ncbi:MAG: hypothetical protein OJF49_004493 [Ktedonobacterales bacterium]|jgi:hypothetical protein|nr:MAG: hypothetical protein OJF49_004493 [Ktedonobacterales bacterium]
MSASARPTAHEWLRRVSDYHSGGISDNERAAVEAHLATCAICQEALTMYRRFYTLARSPLRLGLPSAHFDDTAPTLTTAPRPPRPPRRDIPPARRALLGVAAVLAATLVVVGFLALFSSHRPGPSVASTPTGNPTVTTAPTATPQTTATAEPTTTPAPSAFVCANAPGSNLTYAYERGDSHVYVVTGCSAPRELVKAQAYPVAWSPSNHYLMVGIQQYPNPSPVVAIDAQTGAQTTTHFAIDFGSDPANGDDVRIFLGWLDDNTFLGAIVPITNASPDAPTGISRIVRVDLHSEAETPITTIAWWSVSSGPPKVVDNGRYLLYGGYQNKSEGQAYIHRIDLATGQDTKIAPLGEYGNGGCQGTTICNWTAPWDVTRDGTHVVYHSPGPTSFPSDTNTVADTPLVYASLDGSQRSKPFGSKVAQSLTTPYFSPDGSYVVTAYSNYGSQGPFGSSQVGLATSGGSYTIVNGGWSAWRGDSQAMLLLTDTGKLSLYSLATGATTTLEDNSNYYLWGN